MADITFTCLDTLGIIGERKNQYIALKRGMWHATDREPDESRAKLEIRKWTVDADGKDIAGKGVTFFDEKENGDSLAELLVDRGFGHTRDLLESIKKRKDVKESVESIKNGVSEDEEEDSEDDFYENMNTLLE